MNADANQTPATPVGLLRQLDGWLDQSGHDQDHPWRIAIAATLQQYPSDCTAAAHGMPTEPAGLLISKARLDLAMEALDEMGQSMGMLREVIAARDDYGNIAPVTRGALVRAEQLVYTVEQCLEGKAEDKWSDDAAARIVKGAYPVVVAP